MFRLVNDTTIELSKGDTGAIRITSYGHTFQPEDRALFSIRDAAGTVVKQKIAKLDENGAFVVYFYNKDTDSLAVGGSYSWDVRYVLHPYYNEKGDIVDGNQVITPVRPMGMNILSIVGDI